MKILVDKLQTNSVKVGDTETDTPKNAQITLHFSPLTLEIIKRTVLNAGNISQGVKEVLPAILRLAWLPIEPYIHPLFSDHLIIGY